MKVYFESKHVNENNNTEEGVKTIFFILFFINLFNKYL